MSNPAPENSIETTFDQAVESKSYQNMRECLRSAATVITSASTAYGHDEKALTSYGSDFGDVFPNQENPFMLDWIKSNEIPEENEMSKSENWDEDTIAQPLGDWDSDEEEELDLVQEGQEEDRRDRAKYNILHQITLHLVVS